MVGGYRDGAKVLFLFSFALCEVFLCEPEASTAMKRQLRRTLVRFVILFSKENPPQVITANHFFISPFLGGDGRFITTYTHPSLEAQPNV